ncbi:MAG: sulfatase-like hydrolase/transferase [Planctomycetes bacterium]|nr:sulfatase-like hydrolase/transferase [Planctomycetota bacterium]
MTNIIFIFADDWGFGDLGCQGHPVLKTPHLDRLAEEGTRFTDFHVTSPVCSPSRCSVITGHYPARHLIHSVFGRYHDDDSRHMGHWLDVKVHSLPRLMQEAGYRTAHYGKWHLGGGGGIYGNPDAPYVREYGYDDTRTWNGNGPTWYQTEKWPYTLHNDPDPVWAANSSLLAVDATLEFIGQSGNKPFFVNLWLKDPHTPLHPTPEQREAYRSLPEPEQTYYSVISEADRQIGRLLEGLEQLGLGENTLVIFSSDNGPEGVMLEYGTAGSTGGLRGRKRSLFEGGVRTPFIARWPGRVPAGRVDSTSLLSSVDLMPTFLRLGGVTPPEDWQPDGVDISAALLGESFLRPLPLMWEWRDCYEKEDFWPMLALRDGGYQLLTHPLTGRTELYHIPDDPGQLRDLAPQNPDRVQSMLRQLEEWNQALPGYATRPGAKC